MTKHCFYHVVLRVLKSFNTIASNFGCVLWECLHHPRHDKQLSVEGLILTMLICLQANSNRRKSVEETEEIETSLTLEGCLGCLR